MTTIMRPINPTRRMRAVLRALFHSAENPGLSGMMVCKAAKLWLVPYPELWELETAGWAVSFWEGRTHPEQLRRRLYRLTAEARTRIEREMKEWDK